MEQDRINSFLARSLQTARANLLDSKDLFKGKEKEVDKVEKGLLALSKYLINPKTAKTKPKKAKEDTIESTLSCLIAYHITTEEEYTSNMDKVAQVRAVDSLRKVMSQENFIATLERVQKRIENPNKPSLEDTLKYALKCLNNEKGNFS